MRQQVQLSRLFYTKARRRRKARVLEKVQAQRRYLSGKRLVLIQLLQFAATENPGGTRILQSSFNQAID